LFSGTANAEIVATTAASATRTATRIATATAAEEMSGETEKRTKRGIRRKKYTPYISLVLLLLIISAGKG
jgi:hypothetical protein